MTAPSQAESRTIYAGRVVTLRLDAVPGPDGKPRQREIVEHAPAAAVVAVDAEDRVLLVRQHRPAVGDDLLEIPAGLVDDGETPEAAARRELEEETGLRTNSLTPLARFYSSAGFCTEELHVFLASDLHAGEANLDPGEDVEVVWLPLTQVREMLTRQDLRDAKTLVGLLAYLQRRDAIER